MDKEKVVKFMRQANMKIALIRMNGRYYFCELREELTGWENQPYDDVHMTECPAPIEILG